MSELVAESDVPPTTEEENTSTPAPAAEETPEAAAPEPAPTPKPVPAPTEKKSEGFTPHHIAVGQGAGAGGGLGLSAVANPKVNHFAAKGSKGSGPGLSADMGPCWQNIIGPTTTENFGWLLCEYDATGKNVELKDKGEGGLADFKAALVKCEGCAWGGFRCYGVDNRGNVICKRPKFVFVQYMPASAPPMRRAKMGSHKGALKECFDKAHVDVCVTDANEDLTPEFLAEKLQSATGAHKPNGYEFDVGVITDADYYKDSRK